MSHIILALLTDNCHIFSWFGFCICQDSWRQIWTRLLHTSWYLCSSNSPSQKCCQHVRKSSITFGIFPTNSSLPTLPLPLHPLHSLVSCCQLCFASSSVVKLFLVCRSTQAAAAGLSNWEQNKVVNVLTPLRSVSCHWSLTSHTTYWSYYIAGPRVTHK